jgi:N-acetylneuraminic acid mutarotase
MRNIFLILLFILSFVKLTCAQNSWASMSNFGGVFTYESVGFSINGKGYVGTGNNGSVSNASDEFWEYNPSSNSWTQKANIPGGVRSGAFGFGIGNYGYIGSGTGTTTIYTDFYQYNPLTNTWIQKASHPGSSRRGGVGFSINGKGYMGLGWNNGYLVDFYEYNPVTDIWSSKSNFPGQGRSRAPSFSICDKGYVGGGDIGTFQSLYDFYEFNPTTNSWTQKTNIPGSGQWGDAVGFGICDKGFVAYTNKFNAPNELYEYSASTNSWVQKADYPGIDRTHSTVFTISGKAYVGLGGSSNINQDIFVYTPNTGNAPSQPGAITGNTSPCTGAVETYSVPAVTCAETYTWLFPSGTVINSGTGTNSVTVTWGSTPGTISVTADNACGSSTPRTASVTLLTAPATPGSITGTTNVCVGSSYNYSVASVTGASSYTWALPSGWTGTSTTSSISSTAGTTGGQIQVSASNTCGASNQSSLTVNVVAQNIQLSSASTTTSQTVCAVSPITNITYSVSGSATGATVSGLPSGISGSFASGNFTISGQSNVAGTHTYVVTTTGTCNAVTASGTIVVQATAPALPSAITGNQTVCAGTNQLFSVTQNPSASSYTWAMPAGWTGTSTTNSLNAVAGSTGGVITVTAINACGSSPSQSINVTITPFDLSVTTIGISLQSNQTGASYQWVNCGTGNSIVPGASSQLFTPSTSGTYAVIVTLGACSDTSSCTPLTVTNLEENLDSENSITIWPTLVEDHMNIQIRDKRSINKIEIIDAKGSINSFSELNSFEDGFYSVNVNHLPSGLYLIKIEIGESSIHKRFIRQ